MTIDAPSSMSGLADLVFGVILMVCVLVMPGGLMTLLEKHKAKRKMKQNEEKEVCANDV